MLALKMRTDVPFRHPAEFMPLSDEDLCQEDWGVVFFARRNQKKFWIGLSAWGSEDAWFVQLHHGSFAWLQRFSSSGKNEWKRLLADVHEALANEPTISDIAWHDESEMSKPQPAGFPTPVDA